MKKTTTRLPLWSWVVVVLGMFGILSPGLLPDSIPPDPNDPAQNPDERARLLRKNLAETYRVLDNRVSNEDATPAQRDEVMRAEALRMANWLSSVGPKQSEAFDLGELYRSAQDWKEAERQFEIAVDFYQGRSEDLYVNSLLRLAHVRAEKGESESVGTLIRETYSASRGNKPPILLGVYLEVAPALAKHKHFALAAKLVEEAADQQFLAIVNPDSTSGQVFLRTRPYHLRNAAKYAQTLWTDAGQPTNAERAYREIMQLAKRSDPGP